MAKKKPLTKEQVRERARRYETRGEFTKQDRSAYYRAYSKGWLDEVCEHMVDLRRKWTDEKIRAEAMLYKRRTDFQQNSNQAYQAAVRLGRLDEFCAHMEGRSLDSVYLLELEPGVYKVGLTSSELMGKRLDQLKFENPRVLIMLKLASDAPTVEAWALRIGEKVPELHSEARRWTPDQLKTVMDGFWEERA